MCFPRFYNFLNVFIFTTGLALPLQLNNHFKVLDNVNILSDPIAKFNQIASFLDCAVQCPITSGCIAVTYSSEEKLCLFYDWNGVSLQIASIVPQNILAANMGILSKIVFLLDKTSITSAVTLGYKVKLCQGTRWICEKNQMS